MRGGSRFCFECPTERYEIGLGGVQQSEVPGATNGVRSAALARSLAFPQNVGVTMEFPLVAAFFRREGVPCEDPLPK